MIFPELETVKIAQVGELVTLSAARTFANGVDTITKLEVKPSATEAYVDVTTNNKLAWIYDADSSITATLRVNEDDTTTKSVTFEIVTAESDKLFSKDDDLLSIESEILESHILRDSFSTHNIKHREAQKLILEELNNRGLRDSEGNEITKANIAITKELNAWSRYLTLFLIFYDLASDQDSIYFEKAKRYEKAALAASRDRQFLKIDKDGEGVEVASDIDMAFTTATMKRR